MFNTFQSSDEFFVELEVIISLDQEDNQNEKVEPYYAADELRVPVGMVLVSDTLCAFYALNFLVLAVNRIVAWASTILSTERKERR
jgi:hypothetical protein